jgi:hypothetical protein
MKRVHREVFVLLSQVFFVGVVDMCGSLLHDIVLQKRLDQIKFTKEFKQAVRCQLGTR